MIYNENCLAVMKDLKDESVDMVLTDPPYNITNDSLKQASRWWVLRDNYFAKNTFDQQTEEDWAKLMNDCFEQTARVCKKGANVIVFTGAEKIDKVKSSAEKNGLHYKTFGVWLKSNPFPRNKNITFVLALEIWLYFVNQKASGAFNNDGKVLRNFFESPCAGNGERKHGKHPTQKPVKLMERFIEVLSNENDVVLDPFMGSGSTGVACKNLNRQFIGCELNKDYFEIAKSRIDNENRTSRRGSTRPKNVFSKSLFDEAS